MTKFTLGKISNSFGINLGALSGHVILKKNVPTISFRLHEFECYTAQYDIFGKNTISHVQIIQPFSFYGSIEGEKILIVDAELNPINISFSYNVCSIFF